MVRLAQSNYFYLQQGSRFCFQSVFGSMVYEMKAFLSEYGFLQFWRWVHLLFLQKGHQND